VPGGSVLGELCLGEGSVLLSNNNWSLTKPLMKSKTVGRVSKRIAFISWKRLPCTETAVLRSIPEICFRSLTAGMPSRNTLYHPLRCVAYVSLPLLFAHRWWSAARSANTLLLINRFRSVTSTIHHAIWPYYPTTQCYTLPRLMRLLLLLLLMMMMMMTQQI